MMLVRILTLSLLLTAMPFAAATGPWDDSSDRSAHIDNAVRALSLSANNTLYSLERLENVASLRRSAQFILSQGLLLNVHVHGLTRFLYDPQVREIEVLTYTRDYRVGELLSQAQGRERELYVQRIADAFGELSETNEKIATYQFEFLKANVDSSIVQALRESGLSAHDPRAIDQTHAAFQSFIGALAGTQFIGDVNLFNFLTEILVMRPMRGEPQAAGIAVSLLEKMGEDPRLVRSGLLTAFAEDISKAPGRLGQDLHLAELVETATRVHAKMQAPLWHIACENILTPPRLN